MDRAYLIEVARRASGLTQAELAARSGTSQATLSAYERGLKSPTLSPKEPRIRFIRTRFDPRPPEPTADGMKPAATVAKIAERLATELAKSRHPAAPATWNAGVVFARRWADLGHGHTVVLAPSGPGCVVGITVESYDDPLDVGPIDVDKIADDVVARIHADPAFAARVAAELGADPRT